MDIERAIEFMLKQQARFDSNQAKFEENQAKIEANFAKADQRFLQTEKRLDRLEHVVAQTTRVVGQLASASLRFRNEIRRSQIEADREMKAFRERSSETDDKLNALIDLVDKNIRRNGKRGGQS